MTDELLLTVHVPADEYPFMQRRISYLETLVLRIIRDRGAFPEWLDAGELAALQLPGLPASRVAISQKAGRESWKRRIGKSRRVFFHVSSLPARAFDALIARILDLPELDTDTADLFTPPPAPVSPTMPDNAAPPWVLPPMRLVKAEGDWGRAWRALPDHIPAGVQLPDVEDAAKMLVKLNIL